MPGFALTAAPYVVSVVGLAAATATFVQLTKFLLDIIVKPGSPNQNSVVRLYVFVVAAVVVSAVDFLSYHLASRADILNAAADAVNVAALAIASYHVLTSDALPTFVPGAPLALGISDPVPAPTKTPSETPPA